MEDVRFSITAKDNSSKAFKSVEKSALNTDRSVKGLQNTFDSTNEQNKKLSNSFTHLTGQILKSAPAFAVATAAIGGVYTVLRETRDELVRGFGAVESYKQSVIQMSAIMTTFSQKAKMGFIKEAFSDSHHYAERLVKDIEMMDIASAASAENIMDMVIALMGYRVQVNTTVKEERDAIIALSNAIATLTGKQQNAALQYTQEIRALMTGTIKAGDKLAMMLRAAGLNVKQFGEELKTGKKTLADLLPYLTGFEEASKEIMTTWEAISSTTETIHKKILREGFLPVWEDVTGLISKANSSLMENGELTEKSVAVIEEIQSGWENVKSSLVSIYNPLSMVVEDIYSLKTLTDSLPGDTIDQGIVGYALFRGGGKAALLAAALLGISRALKTIDIDVFSKPKTEGLKGLIKNLENLKEVLQGVRDASTGELNDPEGYAKNRKKILEKELAGIKYMIADWKKNNDTAAGFLMSLFYGESPYEHWVHQKEKVEKQLDELAGKIEDVKDSSASVGPPDMADNTQEELDKVLVAIEKFAFDSGSVWDNYSSKIKKTAPVVPDFTHHMKDLRREAERLDKIWVKTYAATLPQYKKEVYLIKQAYAELDAGVSELEKRFSIDLSDRHTALTARMEEEIADVGNAWSDVVDGMRDALQEFFDWSSDSFMDMNDLVKSIGSDLSGQFSKQISGSIMDMVMGTSGGGTGGSSSGISWFEGLSVMDMATGASNAIYDGVKGWLFGSGGSAITGTLATGATMAESATLAGYNLGLSTTLSGASAIDMAGYGAGVAIDTSAAVGGSAVAEGSAAGGAGFSPGGAGLLAGFGTFAIEALQGGNLGDAAIKGAGAGLGAWGGGALGAAAGAELGGTLGAYLGPVGAVVGAVLGAALAELGLGSSGPKRSYLWREYFPEYDSSKGFHIADVDEYKEKRSGEDFRGTMNKIATQAMGQYNDIAEAFGSVFEGVEKGYPEQYEQMLSQFTGKKDFSWHWGADDKNELQGFVDDAVRDVRINVKDLARQSVGLLVEYFEEVLSDPDTIEAFSHLSSAAKDDVVMAYGQVLETMEIGNKSLTKELEEVEQAIVAIEEISQYVEQLNTALNTVMTTLDYVINPMTDFEEEINSLNSQVFDAILTLASLGVAEEKLLEIDEKRIEAVDKITEGYAKEATEGIMKDILKDAADLARVQESIAKNFSAVEGKIAFQRSGMTEQDYLMSQINAAIAREDVMAVSQLADDWYNAAVKAEQEKANINLDVISKQEAMQETVSRQWDAVAATVAGLLGNIESARMGVMYSGLNVGTPRNRLGSASQDYRSLLRDADDMGDTEALAAFTSFLPTFLSEAQGVHKSSQAYVDIFNDSLADLRDLERTVGSNEYERALFEQQNQESLLISTQAAETDISSINDQFMNWVAWSQSKEETELLTKQTQNATLLAILEKIDRPIDVTVEVGGEEFDAHIEQIADEVRVEATRREVGTLATV